MLDSSQLWKTIFESFTLGEDDDAATLSMLLLRVEATFLAKLLG